jgi:hypothetical protein
LWKTAKKLKVYLSGESTCNRCQTFTSVCHQSGWLPLIYFGLTLISNVQYFQTCGCLYGVQNNEIKYNCIYSHFIGTVEKYIVASPPKDFAFAVNTSGPARISANFSKNSISMLEAFHFRNLYKNPRLKMMSKKLLNWNVMWFFSPPCYTISTSSGVETWKLLDLIEFCF